MLKKFTIKTWDYTESFYFDYDENKKYSDDYFTMDEEDQVESFLAEIGWCDDYEIISIENAEPEAIEKFNAAIAEVKNRGIEVDVFWKDNCSRYASGRYDTIEEMIAENI